MQAVRWCSKPLGFNLNARYFTLCSTLSVSDPAAKFAVDLQHCVFQWRAGTLPNIHDAISACYTPAFPMQMRVNDREHPSCAQQLHVLHCVRGVDEYLGHVASCQAGRLREQQEAWWAIIDQQVR